jgi:pyruvate-ferredoxin/flavodoxin oxidoreductase
VAALIERLHESPDDPAAKDLLSVADHLVRRSIWIVGGDGWAYDIGYGGLDHVLAAGRDVNELLLDTEVYSNTGGQAIAQVAMGGNPQHTLLAFREAEAYPGPSLILAYCHCIAHGIDMQFGMRQQDLAVASGYWPLFRYNPAMRAIGENPFRLDSPRPTIPFRDYAYNELRYRALAQTRPREAAELLANGATHAISAISGDWRIAVPPASCCRRSSKKRSRPKRRRSSG